MKLGKRKIIFIGLLGTIFLAVSTLLVGNLLVELGQMKIGHWILNTFCPATAVAIIAALLFLLDDLRKNGK
jgi:hypothetical protein